MKQKQLDVLLLQETHSDDKNVTDWIKEWNGHIFLSHKTSHSGEVAILFAKNFTPCSFKIEEIVKGRLLKIYALFEKYVLVFICVYAPTLSIKRMFFWGDILCSTLGKCNSEEYLFLSGDFNCVEQNIDRNHIEPHMPSRKRLCEIIERNDLCDVWKNLNGNLRQYTWAHAHETLLQD